MKKKQKKMNFEDHGETIANMNVEGFSWYQDEKSVKRKKTLIDLNLTTRERRALVGGAFKAYLPMFLVIIGGFLITYFLFLLFVSLRN
jgi:hypothetical protein